ncbi:MAG: DUF4097 family beta strand repeat protein [Calditrichaeota bacterium]|nr:DUF4097 family beta strand repeat protein [Calditrichota bacterium]
MKNLKYVMLFLAVATILSAGEMKRQFDVKPGGYLDVDINIGGAIHVSGWSKDQAEIIVNFKGRELDEDVWIDIDQHGNDVTVNGGAERNSNERLDLEIKVPSKYNIKLSTMGGPLSVNGVEGKLDGETMGGKISLKNLKGKVKFSTMGGSIELRDSDVDGKVSTMGGEVLFADVIGDVDGSSMGGNVIYKNVKSRDGKISSGKAVTISTMGGEINVDEALSGADVSTMGGNIHVNKAAEFVKANTMGGTIEIEDIDGWVKATTMGGDVIVNMTGNPSKGRRDVNLSSMGGDILLTLPDGISADFDIRLTYTRRSSQDFKIISDFPIKIDEDKDWNYNDGDPRKVISGTGEINGGKNLIRISTINGDITIKKGK